MPVLDGVYLKIKYLLSIIFSINVFYNLTTKTKLMKTKLLIPILALFLVSLSTNVLAAKKDNLKTSLFNVSMDCVSCKEKIEKNIAFEKGVKDLLVDLDAKTVSVTYDLHKNSDEKLIAAFVKLGYQAAIVPTACGAKSDKNGYGDCKKPCAATDCNKPCPKDKAKSCCDSDHK